MELDQLTMAVVLGIVLFGIGYGIKKRRKKSENKQQQEDLR